MNDRTNTDPEDVNALNWAWRWGVRPIERQTFLALPADKRALAIARIDALQQLTLNRDPPSRAEQQAIAAALEITLPRLQQLMRAWKREQSLSVVVPYLSRLPQGRSHRPGHEIARRIIQKELTRSPSAAEPSISRRIAAICARVGVKSPARMTVRSLLEEARQSLPPPSAILPIDAGEPAEPFVRGLGDKLVLSEQFFEAAFVENGRETIARAFILFDVASGFILATSHERTLGALAIDARRTLLEKPYDVGPWQHPRSLLIGVDLDSLGIERLRGCAEALGIECETVLRRQIALWSDAVLWPGFERLRRTVRPIRRSGLPNDWPRLSPDEFAFLLEEAVSAQRQRVDDQLDEEPGPKIGGERELADVVGKLFN